MLVAAHQPNYLPWLGFLHKLLTADQFMLADTAQFVKRGPFGWIHRNKIRTADGWAWLSLPVKTAGKFTQSCAEAELDNSRDWRRKHWLTLEQQYRLAPHFGAYSGPFREVYQREWTHLAPLSEALIRALCEAFRIDTPIKSASACGVEGEATGLVISVCRHYGASRYLSGVHGHDYLDMPALAAAGVEIVWQQFEHARYPQWHGGQFQPGMCGLDLLFNTGPDAAKVLRDCGGSG